jgi:hypothetical protein
VAALFFFFAWVRPAALKLLNLIWFKFGLILHKVINPVVMVLVFFGTVLPTGLIMRALGKDPLRLKRQPNAKTYWIERLPGPAVSRSGDCPDEVTSSHCLPRGLPLCRRCFSMTRLQQGL